MRARSMAGHVIRRLHQLSTMHFTNRMRAEGLDITSVQFAAMDALQTEPGMDQATLAAKIAYDRATIGGVVDRLVAKGLVERTVSLKDRRARELILSEQGEQLHATLSQIVDDIQDDILARLSTTERKQFHILASKALGTDFIG